MDHFKVLKRALRITWDYRALWLVGLLLVLAGGGVWSGARPGGPGSPGAPSSNGGPSFEGPGRPPDMQGAWEEVLPILIAILIAVAVVVIALVLLAVVVGLLAIVVRYITRTSLIEMVQSYEETGEQIGVWSGLRLGWSRSALRLFVVDLILRLPLALLMIALIVPLLILAVLSFTTGKGPAIALGVVLVLLIVPVILIGIVVRALLGPVLEVVYRVSVIEKKGAWEAIKAGWDLIRRNLGATALQWLLMVGLGIAWRIALIPVNLALVVVAALVGGLPALLLGGASGLLFSAPVVGIVVGLLTFVPTFIVFLAVPNIALTTLATVFYSTAWTLAYRELNAIDES
jgi:hypothetical protein